ncbi:MAG: hypothetical protein IJS66_04680 [Bacteroidales bacterium]|nr:hypothetical protein [Bacteroidales bacterium]
MRKIIVSLSVAFVPLLAYSWSSPKDEPNQLSYVYENVVPGATVAQLETWASDWYRGGNEFFNDSNSNEECLAVIMCPGIYNDLFVFNFWHYRLRQKQHVIAAKVSIACFNGRYIVEMTNIMGTFWGGDIMEDGRFFMTADGTRLARFPFRSVCRRNYWKIRQSIEEDFFPRLCASIHRAMLEHA